MDEGIIERIVDALEPVANKLGEGAEALWHLSVRQAYVEGIIAAVFAVLLVAGIIATVLVARWCYRGAQAADSYEDAGWIAGGVMTAVIGLMLCVALPFAITIAIRALANPHFYAVEKLLSTVKGG